MLAEHGGQCLDDEQQDTTTWRQTENLGCESLVESTEAFLTGNAEECGVGPFSGRVELETRLDDVDWGSASFLDSGAAIRLTWSVDDGTDETTDSSCDKVVEHLLVLSDSLGEESLDLEDRTKVTTVPPNVAPEGRLHTLVEAGVS